MAREFPVAFRHTHRPPQAQVSPTSMASVPRQGIVPGQGTSRHVGTVMCCPITGASASFGLIAVMSFTRNRRGSGTATQGDDLSIRSVLCGRPIGAVAVAVV